jgi:hypothetical protein
MLKRCAPLLLIVLVAPACPTRDATDVTGDAGQSDGQFPERPTATKLPPPVRKAQGDACSLPTECASGFCSDGVCCDSACDGTCFGCNAPGELGSCVAVDHVDDPAATAPCVDPSTCTIDSSGLSRCRLKDGEPCAVDSDCATGSCRRYFPDADGDGYGVDSAEVIARCDAVPRAPNGFAAAPGDCCDLDPGAHPGTTSFFTSADRCGTFDWNCSGSAEKQSVTSCPTAPAGLACGQSCSIVFRETSTLLYVQACH